MYFCSVMSICCLFATYVSNQASLIFLMHNRFNSKFLGFIWHAAHLASTCFCSVALLLFHLHADISASQWHHCNQQNNPTVIIQRDTPWHTGGVSLQLIMSPSNLSPHLQQLLILMQTSSNSIQFNK